MRTRIIIATFIITCCLLFLLSFVTSQSFKIDTVVGHRFYDGEGGLASHIGLRFPHSVAFHPVTGDLFIVDMYNHVIRKVDKASGVIPLQVPQVSRDMPVTMDQRYKHCYSIQQVLRSVSLANQCLSPILGIIV